MTTVVDDALAAEIRAAETLARKFHHGVTDRHGIPYIDHVAWVAAHVDDASRPAAWLHDVLEDTPATEEDLRAAGISEISIAAVGHVTRDPQSGLSYMDWIRQIAEVEGEIGRRARQVKLKDNLHNQRRPADPRLRGKPNTRYPRAEKILRTAIAAHGESLDL